MKKLIIAVIATTAVFVIAKLQQQSPKQEVEEVDTLDPVDTTEDEDEEQQQQVESETPEPVDLFNNYTSPEKKARDFLREFDERISEIRTATDKTIADKITKEHEKSLAMVDELTSGYKQKVSDITREIREKALAGEDISALCDELSKSMASVGDALK